MQEMGVGSLGWEDPLEEAMATLSSILVWRIPWTKEPGELQSIELQSIGYDAMWKTGLRSLGWEDSLEKGDCLEDSMDRGAWWATIHGIARSRT